MQTAKPHYVECSARSLHNLRHVASKPIYLTRSPVVVCVTYHLPTENTASLPQIVNVFGLYHRLLQLLLQCAHTSVQLADDTVLYVIYGPHVLL